MKRTYTLADYDEVLCYTCGYNIEFIMFDGEGIRAHCRRCYSIAVAHTLNQPQHIDDSTTAAPQHIADEEDTHPRLTTVL